MRVPILIGSVIVHLCFAFATSAQLSQAQKTAAVQTVASQIASNYVDANLGGQISSYILTANHQGEFNKAETWAQFDEMLNSVLQQFSKDKHIYLRNNSLIVQQLRSPAAEKKAAMNTQNEEAHADKNMVS